MPNKTQFLTLLATALTTFAAKSGANSDNSLTPSNIDSSVGVRNGNAEIIPPQELQQPPYWGVLANKYDFLTESNQEYAINEPDETSGCLSKEDLNLLEDVDFPSEFYEHLKILLDTDFPEIVHIKIPATGATDPSKLDEIELIINHNSELSTSEIRYDYDKMKQLYTKDKDAKIPLIIEQNLKEVPFKTLSINCDKRRVEVAFTLDGASGQTQEAKFILPPNHKGEIICTQKDKTKNGIKVSTTIMKLSDLEYEVKTSQIQASQSQQSQQKPRLHQKPPSTHSLSSTDEFVGITTALIPVLFLLTTYAQTLYNLAQLHNQRGLGQRKPSFR